MKYFLIKTDTLYTDIPDIKNWFTVFDKRDIDNETSYKIPNRLLLQILPNKKTIFTDVLSFPYFMVTEKLKDVIKMYEPTTIFKEIILLDSKNGLSKAYYLPILNKVDCLSEKSELTLDKSSIINAVLDLEKVKDNCIFKISSVKDSFYVIRLDMAESFLRRGAKGIGLTDVECVN